jgi:hypothetical protein
VRPPLENDTVGSLGMFRCVCPPQDRFDEFGFGLVIGLAVVAVFAGKCALQLFISLRMLRIGAQVVTEHDVPAVFARCRSVDIEVMRNIIRR